MHIHEKGREKIINKQNSDIEERKKKKIIGKKMQKSQINKHYHYEKQGKNENMIQRVAKPRHN